MDNKYKFWAEVRMAAHDALSPEQRNLNNEFCETGQYWFNCGHSYAEVWAILQKEQDDRQEARLNPPTIPYELPEDAEWISIDSLGDYDNDY